MVDHTGARLAQPDSTVKRPERQVAGHASAHGPADDAPGVEVEHDGATVLDRDQADLGFLEIVDAWLREELSGEASGLLAELVLQDPGGTVGLIRSILNHLRRYRVINHDAPEELAPLAIAFQKAAEEFKPFVADSNVNEAETAVIAGQFGELAGAIEFPVTAETPADFVKLLLTTPHSGLCTTSGSFRKYQKKGKWGEAAKRKGLAKADGDQLNAKANAHYDRCCETWTALLQAAASCVLADLIQLVRPVVERFREHKRSAALLDFDDLIFAARDLLRDHDDVRRALAARFTHVLVGEFQDTDPLQTEIFWRLCGDPPANGETGEGTSFELRPGTPFLWSGMHEAVSWSL